jgi:hypothetical protein
MPNTTTNEEPIEDYLEEDKAIPGQKYVCLSFISPEKVLDDKKTHAFYHYLKQEHPEYAKTYSQFKEEFGFYQEDNEEKLQAEFDELVDYQTSVRGVKVRGVYDNVRAANIRAKVLQKLDRSFHVYVGQVGYWLPWDPTANNIEDQEYAEPELNRLVKEYNNNESKKDLFYEEQKREKQKAAMEESMRLQKLNEAEKLKLEEDKNQSSEVNENTETILQELDNQNSTITDSEALGEEVNTVSIKTTAKEEQTEMSSENVVDEQLKESLDAVDPWMERKMEEQGSN